LRRLRTQAMPALAPAAITATAAGPVSVTGTCACSCGICASSGRSIARESGGCPGSCCPGKAMVVGCCPGKTICCIPGATIPSLMHIRSQPSPSSRFPSSQVSPMSRMPSPHPALIQLVLHRAPGRLEFWNPSSHSSPGSSFPSPQKRKMNWQSSEHL